jgi:hypothetical protein
MFAGFKGTPPINVSAHSSTVLQSGSAVNRQQGINPALTTNNIIIGSGFSMSNPTATNIVYIAHSDYNATGLSGNPWNQTNYIFTGGPTADPIVMIGGGGQASNTVVNTTISSYSFVQIGKFNGTQPGIGSVQVGATAQSGASGSNAISIGATNAAGTKTIAISGSAQSNSGNYSITIGDIGTSTANTINLTATGSANPIAEFAGLTSFYTGNWGTYGSSGWDSAFTGNCFINFWRLTADATTVEVGGGAGNTDTPANYINFKNYVTAAFDLTVAARSANGVDSAAWKLQFVAVRNNGVGTMVIVGTPVITQIAASAGVSGWTPSVIADTTNGRPAIKVTGQAATSIRWIVTGSMSRVPG